MTSALADDWRDVPPPVVSHPRDALTLGRWPWDTAPQPAPVAPVAASVCLTPGCGEPADSDTRRTYGAMRGRCVACATRGKNALRRGRVTRREVAAYVDRGPRTPGRPRGAR